MPFILLGRGPVVRDTGLSSPPCTSISGRIAMRSCSLVSRTLRSCSRRTYAVPGFVSSLARLATFSERMQQETDAETYCGWRCPQRTAPSDSGSTMHAGVTVTSDRGRF
jgi:hypothetical protein